MFGLLLLLLLLVPVAELYVIVEVWQRAGGVETLFLLVAVSVVGAWLVKREGLGVLRRVNQQLAEGNLPTSELIDGALIVLAGAFMLTPGFLTDGVGLLLLLPPTRAALRLAVRRRLERRVERFGEAAGIRFVTFGGPVSARRSTVVDPEVGGFRPDRPGGTAGELDR